MTRPPRQIDDRADILDAPALHWPQRPGWTCSACAEDWPCTALCGHLLATLDRADISRTMGTYYDNAVRELDVDPAVVHQRFFAWHRV